MIHNEWLWDCTDLGADYYLGKQQNAITNTGVDGQPVDMEHIIEEERKNGIWYKLKSLYYRET